jgi:hypothetical protein
MLNGQQHGLRVDEINPVTCVMLLEAIRENQMRDRAAPDAATWQRVLKGATALKEVFVSEDEVMFAAQTVHRNATALMTVVSAVALFSGCCSHRLFAAITCPVHTKLPLRLHVLTTSGCHTWRHGGRHACWLRRSAAAVSRSTRSRRKSPHSPRKSPCLTRSSTTAATAPHSTRFSNGSSNNSMRQTQPIWGCRTRQRCK